ncbi:MAG: helix-turn-helix domain-containing protein [Clostridia bacterium]|nr:helix-turn-helix domain-containing protein [Clostridia bacterium]
MGKVDFWLTPEGLILLRAKSRDSLTRNELAKKLEIAPKTLSIWESKYPQIEEALRQGREITDVQVENAILKKALGFETTEIKKVVKADGAEEITTIQKCVPPDVSAASVWLKNRCPERWRDKPQEEDSLSKVDKILEEINAQANR